MSFTEDSVYRSEAIEKYRTSIFEPLFYKKPRIFDPVKFSVNKMKWALTYIWAKSSHLENGEIALIPVVNFFSEPLTAKPNPFVVKVEAQWNDNSLDFIATGTIFAGETIYSPFSLERRLSNGQLLLDYGFVVSDNQNNAIIIENPIISDDPNYQKKKEVLQSKGAWRYAVSVKYGLTGVKSGIDMQSIKGTMMKL